MSKLEVREARPEDAQVIAQVHVDSWRSTYRGIVPDAHLAGLSYERRQQFWSVTLKTAEAKESVYVAEDAAGEVVGFASAGPERSGSPDYTGELYAIYLLQAFQRQGFGRRLTHAVSERLLRLGHTSMLLWVVAENPARHFYESIGGRPVQSQPIEIGGTKLEEIAYGWDDIKGLL
ncbi:MAG: GNAT family N-acetyltransferase [Dehalococcoidia bacterium]